jgi:hypothetical protein
VHHGSSVYQFKSTSISTVTFPPADSNPGIRATFGGTGTISDITDPAHPVVIPNGSNATIQASVHDAGEPGTSDTTGFTIRLGDTGKTLWYSNNLVNGQTVEARGDGGNIQVRAAQLAADFLAANLAAPAPLTLDLIEPVVAAAGARWEAAGIDPRRLNSVMENVSFRLDNLTGTDLAWSSPGVITINPTAAGFGWFIDPTPGSDSEFAPGTVNTPAQGRMDLLSVVAHEIGLHLGFGEDDGTAVMAQYLPAGVTSTTTSPQTTSPETIPVVRAGHARHLHRGRQAVPVHQSATPAGRAVHQVDSSRHGQSLDGSPLHDLALEQVLTQTKRKTLGRRP